MAPEPASPFPAFDMNQFVGTMSRLLQGPEQAMRVYRELLGLEGGSREKSVDFMAQLARGYGLDATPLFEGVLRFGPTDTARVAAAAYLAEQGREETVLEVLESLQPPVLTMTLLSGLADVLAVRWMRERTIRYRIRGEDAAAGSRAGESDASSRDASRATASRTGTERTPR
jgi:hypothetical protein